MTHTPPVGTQGQACRLRQAGRQLQAYCKYCDVRAQAVIVVVVITVNVVVSKDSLGDGDEGDKLVM